MTDKTYPSIDGYRILRVIGHGGMSTVYLAEQLSLGRKVALKVMLAEALADEISRARFENEARTIARLEHPNIVGIFEVGRTSEGLPFYSMPYLAHGHLAQRKLAGDQPKVAAILRSLLQALDYAHVRGVVHRDVKAENVLFDDVDRPLLADFGIALRRGSNPRLTSAGLAVGSTAYMPPEQARGLEVDRRADVYSIGVLAWEMLVGQLPYNAGDALSMALKHLQEPVPRLPAALKHWQGFIDTALAKQPSERFASADDMLVALDRLERRAGKAFTAVEVPDSWTPAVAAPKARLSLRTALIAGVVLAAAGGGAIWLATQRAAPAADAEPAVHAAITTPPPTGQTPLSVLPAPAPAAGGILHESEHGGPSIAAFIANAEQQLGNGQLLAPRNANAWNSLEAAWRLQPTHPDTLRMTALLFDALGNAAERAIGEGDSAAAANYFRSARLLDQRRGGTGSAVALLRKRLDAALEARLTALLAKPAGQPAAAALLATTDWLGLDASRRHALQDQIDRQTASAGTPAVAKPEPASPKQILTVLRADYARFANASGRAPAECGRGFLGRRLKWSNTGRDSRPVVCVSAADALAFAAWLGAQDGHRYRLPSAGEARSLPGAAVSGWLNQCADQGCQQRQVSGSSQPVAADQGHDDVGLLLVRLD